VLLVAGSPTELSDADSLPGQRDRQTDREQRLADQGCRPRSAKNGISAPAKASESPGTKCAAKHCFCSPTVWLRVGRGLGRVVAVEALGA
jgi:hypothetical protein